MITINVLITNNKNNFRNALQKDYNLSKDKSPSKTESSVTAKKN